MLRRLVPIVVTVAVAVVMATATGSAGVDDGARLIVNVDPRQAVFAGAVAAGVTQPAERLEIVLASGVQPESETHDRMTAALIALARDTLPRAILEPLPDAVPGRRRILSADRPPGVRIRLSTPASDVSVRDSVNRLLAAANSGRYGDVNLGARIISIDHIFAGCAPFDAATRYAARTRVARLAGSIGTPITSGIALQRLPAARAFEASPEGTPHCNAGFAILPDASLPSSASYRFTQAFAFAQPIRFTKPSSVARTHEVRALWSGPLVGPRLNLRAPGVLLTVEGNAALERRAAGTLITYSGPNGRYYLRDVTLEALDGIRRRLRAAGVAEGNIITQLRPDNAEWYVQVRSTNIRQNEAIVAAIGGNVSAERDAVQTTAFGDTCADEQGALGRAVADAQARAQRIATGLHASIDLSPMAVRTGAGSGFTPCTERGSEYEPPAPMARHISGLLQRPQFDSGDVAVTAFAVFRIEHPQRSGTVRAQVASDDPASYNARFGYTAPPVDYPDAVHADDAQVETRLRPRRLRVDMTLSPDNRHNFHAIDPGLAAGIARTLGASEHEYTAAFTPDTQRGSGEPALGELNFKAEVPSNGSVTESALNAALTSALSAGYGGFSLLPESDGCAAVDDALALDAIHAAARNATPSDRKGRVVAIDVRGPGTVDGVCSPTNSGVASWAIRDLKIKDVRMAAYARISYGN